MIPQSRLTSQGQISVPLEIRKKLGIGPGSVLEWKEEGDQVIVSRAARFSSEDIHRALFGPKPPKARSGEELREGIRSYVRKRYARG